MTITVGVDTYISVNDANNYLQAQGYETLDANLDEQLLTRATKAIDRKYGNRFIGQRTSSGQALYWPRFATTQFDIYQRNAYGELVQWTSATIPQELQEATAELALMLMSGFDPYAQQEAGVKEKSESVEGAVSVSYKYNGIYVSKSLEWATLDTILGPLLGAARGSAATLTMGRGA